MNPYTQHTQHTHHHSHSHSHSHSNYSNHSNIPNIHIQHQQQTQTQQHHQYAHSFDGTASIASSPSFSTFNNNNNSSAASSPDSSSSPASYYPSNAQINNHHHTQQSYYSNQQHNQQHQHHHQQHHHSSSFTHTTHPHQRTHHQSPSPSPERNQHQQQQAHYQQQQHQHQTQLHHSSHSHSYSSSSSHSHHLHPHSQHSFETIDSNNNFNDDSDAPHNKQDHHGYIRSPSPDSYSSSSSSSSPASFSPFNRLLSLDAGQSSCVFNLSNVVLGSGIICLPYAVNQSGLLCGILLILLQAWITDYTLRSLVTNALKYNVADYEELLGVLFGKKGWLLGLGLIFLLDYGVMITFMMIIKDNFSSVFDYYYSGKIIPDEIASLDDLQPGSIFGNTTFTLCLISCGVMAPLSFLKDLKALSWVSMISVGNVILIVLLIGGKLLFGTDIDDDSSGHHHSPASVSALASSNFIFGPDLLLSFGSISFIFVCHDVSFQVFQQMQAPLSSRRWNTVVHTSILGSLVPILILSVTGYISFHYHPLGIQANILNNFPFNDHLINLARCSLGISMIMTYPLNLFMCRHVIKKMLFTQEIKLFNRTMQQQSLLSSSNHNHAIHHSHSKSSSNLNSASPSSSQQQQQQQQQLSSTQHIVITSILFITSLYIACSVDDLGWFQSMIGNFAGCCLAFILPAIIQIRIASLHQGRPLWHMQNAPQLCLLAFSALVVATTIYQTILNIQVYQQLEQQY